MPISVNNRTILVTGSHRSGSTFVGTVLSLPLGYGYLREPFNKVFGVEGVDEWFPYVWNGSDREHQYKTIVNEVLSGKATFKPSRPMVSSSKAKALIKRMTGYRPLSYLNAKYNPTIKRLIWKDPLACLSAEWLHTTYSIDVVIVVRHPAAFVASLKSKNWRFDFSELLSQTDLMDQYLDPYIGDLDINSLSLVEEGALLWKCLYSVLHSYAERNPGMIVVRHEDISREPVDEFSRLFSRLGVEFSPSIQKKIIKLTSYSNTTDGRSYDLRRNSKENIHKWKTSLTSRELDMIREITSDTSEKFYTEEDW